MIEQFKSKWDSLRLVLGIAIFILMIYFLDANQIYQTLIQFSPLIILIIIALVFVQIFISALNLLLLLSSIGIHIPFKFMLKKYALALAIGKISPGRFGEFSIIYFLRKKAKYGIVGAVALVDKIITFGVLIGISIFGIFIFQRTDLIWLILIASAILLLVILLPFSKTVREWVRKFFLKKFSDPFPGFSKSLNRLKTKHRAIGFNIILTIIRSLASAVAIMISLKLIGVDVSVIYIIIINSISILISILPISLAGLGVKEVSATYLFGLIGANSVIIASLYILFRIVTTLVAGTLFMFNKYLK